MAVFAVAMTVSFFINGVQDLTLPATCGSAVMGPLEGDVPVGVDGQSSRTIAGEKFSGN
ncbi:MAG: hypothetical protein JWN03_7579 [Nocardia sp.]|uniref:hypothetical protein n=1 Tax=Nocardia sp. TaxID=1821 RepID=UPI00262F06CE|nr:hypothetical protein [Nocardia sp.]MCU1647304.1 hypothetical protein [Nocardia sp.]